MTQELGKYYLQYAWFPKILNNGKKIWLQHYYEVHLDLPILDLVYTIKRLDTAEYIIECLRGNIVDGYSIRIWEEIAFEESMLNAAKSFSIRTENGEL
jgi:hypothetical protein